MAPILHTVIGTHDLGTRLWALKNELPKPKPPISILYYNILGFLHENLVPLFASRGTNLGVTLIACACTFYISKYINFDI